MKGSNIEEHFRRKKSSIKLAHTHAVKGGGARIDEQRRQMSVSGNFLLAR